MIASADHSHAVELELISQILTENPIINDLALQDLTCGVNNPAAGANGMSAEQGVNLTDGSVVGNWRLPIRKELLSLIDYSRYNPSLPQGHLFDNVQLSYYYWSATTRAHNTGNMYSVYMGNGLMGSISKSDGNYVWPVRGGQQ